jgi:exopolysaccharide biosynthesis protein
MKKPKIIIFFVIFEMIFVPLMAILLIYYGPFTNIRDMIVTTAMTTMKHQYFATLFLSDEKIQEILVKNRPKEILEEQELSDIKVNENVNDGIELIDVSSNNFKGYLLVVNDPSRVKLASTPRLGKVGATTSQIVEYYDAIGGINAGGFEDDALGTGGKPSGILIEDGELKFSNYSGSNHAVVGLDRDNRMIVSNSINYSTLKSKNVRDAVSFGPVIIVNGMPTIRSGDGGWGIQPRTAIGQKKDGTVLMLVIDGRQADSIGATLKNVQDIFLKYDAYNAFNLDGGASSTMVYDEKVVNKPSDIMGERYVPSAFIITKPKK